MDFDAYQLAAARTGGSDLRPSNQDKGLNCAALGLCGEAGEFADLVEKLRAELGDVLWYAAHACNVMGWRLAGIAEGNIEKLRARYPEGFSTEASIAKADER